MSTPAYQALCGLAGAEAHRLAALAANADPATPVPTCPGWTITDLTGHVTGNLHALAGVTGSVAEAGAAFERAMLAADPDEPREVFGLTRPVRWWVRRAAYDLLIHRADVALALGEPFSADPAVAVDVLDELLELVSGPRGGTDPTGALHLHATDTPGAEWLVEPSLAWRRAHEKTPTAIRGPLVDVLLVAYRRLPPSDVEVFGDSAELTRWLDRLNVG
ncbi:MAG: hypothetical protein QOJ50_3330 [Cryptosporangiaceae bacterium]|nr:hypothetical protein [Cryptosporangiaceae bacterium]